MKHLPHDRRGVDSVIIVEHGKGKIQQNDTEVVWVGDLDEDPGGDPVRRRWNGHGGLRNNVELDFLNDFLLLFLINLFGVADVELHETATRRPPLTSIIFSTQSSSSTSSSRLFASSAAAFSALRATGHGRLSALIKVQRGPATHPPVCPPKCHTSAEHLRSTA